jgi:diguanylate cyclase (GGDEF)-like protein
MNKALQIAYASLIIILLSFAVASKANEAINFRDMDHDVYLKPWQSYQKIIGLESAAQSYDELTYLWWLLRKAQTENLIYFYDDFILTVAQANGLISVKTPLAITARLSLYQGLIHRRQGNYKLSKEVLTKGLMQAKEAKLSSLYIYTKQELAYTKTLTELFDTSLVDIQEAYVEAFALKDQFLIATINDTYGAIYGYLNDYEKSIEYYQRSYEAFQNLQYPAHIAVAVYGLASTYRYWKKYDLAIEYFKKYQQQIIYTPNANINFFAEYGLGMTLAEKGDCLEAIKVINTALKLEGILDYNAELYKRKASCLIALGQLEAAEEALFNAANIFANIPELIGTTWQLEVIKISSELAYARGQYDISYSILKKYHLENTDLLIKNSSDRLLQVRARMEVDRHKIAQNLAEKRSQVQMLEIEKRQNDNVLQVYFNIFIISVIFIVIVIMVAQYRTNKKMHLLSIKDPLTGLFNRRYIFEYLQKALEGGCPDKIALTIVLIDIDDFKKINDSYGHPIGDNVIKKVAQVGRDVFRQDDIFGRIGGEEFLCILPRTNIVDSTKIAQRFLALTAASTMVEEHSDQVTVSIGIAEVSLQCKDVNQLYINADKALYQAKHLGKNQVNVF